jgi:hypothetical protein
VDGSEEGPAITVRGASPIDHGTGYRKGDTLTVVHASGSQAILSVSAISGGGATGPITSLVVLSAGAYYNPPLAPTGVTGGAGLDATLQLTFSGVAVKAVSIHEGGAGTGYDIGGVLTVVGGISPHGGYEAEPATFVVTTVDDEGGITGLNIKDEGLYSILPTTPNEAEGGGGSGAILDLTFGPPITFIAKTPVLRLNRAAGGSETVEGVGIDYTWSQRTNNSDGQRTASVEEEVLQTEIVVPIWHVGAKIEGSEVLDPSSSEIFAFAPIGGTRVVGDGAHGAFAGCPLGRAITLMDRNIDARRWNQIESE